MEKLEAMVPWERLVTCGYALFILLSGLLFAKLLSSATGRLIARRFGAQQALIGRRLVYWLLTGITLASVLRQLGFDLSVLLGAAGVLTVAIGFASQTSASNLISGLFLIGERPFVIGDVIQVGDTTGEVVSIDLLSVKLRTANNLFVRVPNESLLKANITNLTYYPIRRFDLKLTVPYGEELPRIRTLLAEVADKDPLCLDEPKPLFVFQGFGPAGMDVQFSVWSTRANFLDLQNGIAQEVKAAFARAGIDMPYQQHAISTGSTPLTVKLVREDADGRDVAIDGSMLTPAPPAADGAPKNGSGTASG